MSQQESFHCKLDDEKVPQSIIPIPVEYTRDVTNYCEIMTSSLGIYTHCQYTVEPSTVQTHGEIEFRVPRKCFSNLPWSYRSDVNLSQSHIAQRKITFVQSWGVAIVHMFF